MKNPVALLARSVVRWFRSNHRISPERILQSRDSNGAVNSVGTLAPEEFRRMLAETLAADPELARQMLRPLSGTVIPIVAGACDVPATDVAPGVFGTECSVGNYSFQAGANVGFGTSTPTNQIQVAAAGPSPITLTRRGSGSGSAELWALGIQAVVSDTLLLGQSSSAYSTGGTIQWIGNSNAFLYFNSGQQLRIGAGTGSTPYLTIAGSTGNIGIANASPSEKLDVVGNAKVSGNLAVDTSTLFVDATNDRVGIGTASPQSKLNVKGSASFTATGSVAVSGTLANPTKTVTGTGTSFLSQVVKGDRITVTVGGITLTRTVAAISNDTSLTVDAYIHVTGSTLTMTVLPSIFRGDNSSTTPQFTECGDGNVQFAGFLGAGGTPIHNDDDVGYIVCFFDNEANPFVNTNNEMRGFNATMRYTRNNNSADANAVYDFMVSTSGTTVNRVSGPNFIVGTPWNGSKIEIQGVKYAIASVSNANQLTLTTSAPTFTNVPAVAWQAGPPANLYAGLGWDVRPMTGAVVLQNMNLPTNDTQIRGDMKPFQSELFFLAKASGAPSYSVVRPTLNYVASLTAVHEDCTIDKWAGYMVDSPCEVCGAANKVTHGYGVWVQDLDDGISTLVAANAAAIKIDGLATYGRILWRDRVDIDSDWCSIYRPDTSGVLELRATKADQNPGVVQTASGVNFNVGGSGGNAICNAAGYRVGGAASSGNYLRGNGTDFVSSAIQGADLPVGIYTRVFNQDTRPSLNSNEVAWWGSNTRNKSGPLVFDGTNFLWIWADLNNAPTVGFTVNPSVNP